MSKDTPWASSWEDNLPDMASTAMQRVTHTYRIVRISIRMKRKLGVGRGGEKLCVREQLSKSEWSRCEAADIWDSEMGGAKN